MAGMTGKIFVHIGLPKTATTTLQSEVFPAIAGDGISYLGVVQPRGTVQQGYLYRDIYLAVNGEKAVRTVNNTLQRRLESGDTLIVSEEMFTVSGMSITWRDKLKNLAGLLNGLDYKLILTVREPASAIFSYYVERYEIFKRKEISFFKLATTEDSMKIFHYRELMDEMFKHFYKERVFAIKFEELVSGELEDLCRLVTSGKHGWNCALPKKHNERKRIEGVVYTGKNIALIDVARRAVNLRGVAHMRRYACINKLLVPIAKMMTRMTFSEIKVTIPSTEEMTRLKAYLKDETAVLDKYYRIKYE